MTMFGLPLAFGAPAILFGLLALPVIWWLLRLTPPRPVREIFPPLAILERLIKPEETPHKSPWWLTALRLLAAALVILALAEPVLNPRQSSETATGPVALLIDNGWASSQGWDKTVEAALAVIDEAGDADQPVLLAFSTLGAGQDAGPFDAARARELLRAASPKPVPADRALAVARLAGILEAMGSAPQESRLYWLSDGIAYENDDAAFSELMRFEGNVVAFEPDATFHRGLTAIENTATAFRVTAIRHSGATQAEPVTVAAFDAKGRRIADTQAAFEAGSATLEAEIAVPFELRNDFASVAIDGEASAAAVRVLDDNAKRRRIGLISAAEADQSQPLLSPLYYIRKALEPFADLVEPTTADLSEAIPQVLEQKPAIIVLADVEFIPPQAHESLAEWVRGGGTLVRFAGPRLASEIGDREDILLPVRLRAGGRDLGGTLSWTVPQPVADFPAIGPFAGLTPPRDVTVTRQVLAEPGPELVERTWAGLADGTPLVTGKPLGDGTVTLFHVTPQATWSNLPISGTFIDMLRRLIAVSTNQGRVSSQSRETVAPLPPLRLLDAEGRLGPPPPEAGPLDLSVEPAVTLENPPGLYGTEDGLAALNLLEQDDTITPVDFASLPSVQRQAYPDDTTRDLRPWLFLMAFALLVIDTIAVMAMSGSVARMRRKFAKAAPVAAALFLSFVFLLQPPTSAFAQQVSDAKPGDAEAVDAISRTRLAYVITGSPSVDAVSRAGLDGLTAYLASRTAMEPARPQGVDPETDELAFYPIIYWPIDANAPMPSPAAIARVDAYMQQGGTVLFDTRDQLGSGFGFDGAATPEARRLREILASINVPPLEPVPADHVLTKSFYILADFPGRFRGSPLWVEASLEAESSADRPVRTGDGVSPILITGNDLAGAWAIDSAGNAMFPTVPNDPVQRIHAFRTGVNIMMYMLTGNYKSDQVHIPALLERLGQ